MSVVVVEITDAAAGAAKDRTRQSLDKAASRGKITEETAVATLQRISFATDLGMLKDRDLVVEAASEREDVKLDPFWQVGRLLENDEAILACNTSSIPIVKLGAVSGRADRVMGVHFFMRAS
ncbi:hypothetical protein GCM10023350_09870 [Nocardioides endophyticus]|uniref:3-hydroxyacyl-CoA dehydrogenase NAD binding domain-containing protein n=1 Tax=Nocardioides endophyticus TaxID=1353775 RepID=A0ABP8YIL5_9ACTN